MSYAARNPGPGTARPAYLRPGKLDDGLAVVDRPTAADIPAGQESAAARAGSARRVARLAIWALPAYAAVYGTATLGAGGSEPSYLRADDAVGVVMGIIAGWLGLVAALALAALLAPVRGHTSAIAGFASVVAGAAVLLPIAGASVDSPAVWPSVRYLQWTALALIGLGWQLLGWAVFRSRLFNRVDGVLLMLAGPLLVAGAVTFGPLRTVGALLLLAAGMGIAWTADRVTTSARQARARAPA
jgi:Amt family ammonium transporter